MMSPIVFPTLSTTIQERRQALERIVGISLVHSHSVLEASTKSSKCLQIFFFLLLDVVFWESEKKGFRKRKKKTRGSMCNDREGVREVYIKEKRMILRSKI